jgi:hypothetical protein
MGLRAVLSLRTTVAAAIWAAAFFVLWMMGNGPAAPAQSRADVPSVSSAAPASAVVKMNFAQTIAPILNDYCVECHGGSKPKAGFSLEFKDERAVQESLLRDRSQWELISGRLRKQEMPPADEPQPTAAEKNLLLAWVERDVLAVDCGGQGDPGHVTLRRLNKAEYDNTIRDLFGIDHFTPADDFPADDAGYGFDTNGDTLTLSPLLLEGYLKAAERVTELVAHDHDAKELLFAPVADFPEDFYNHQERAKRVLQAILPRIYRQPVTDDQIERLMKFVRISLAQDGESSDRAVMLAIRAALVSPHFIFHLEMDAGSGGGDDIVPVNEYQLASRLSYFLWSSMPDDQLFDLARQGKLRANLEPQVRRMLKDPKAHALTENFAGQWLEIRGLKDHVVDTALYPQFNDALRADMLTETQLYFDAVVQEDRSVLDFLDSDFTFINQRLAQLYGIDGVSGDQFRRVMLTGGRRGGLLTQASILTLTSTPTRTSPVKRGKWILDNILNAPPPPPPPDVPALEEDGKPLTGTLRQVMQKHRANASCAVCHDSIDPLGLAFENFNAIGAWRDRDGDLAIDAAGTLKDGSTYKNVQDLRAILKSKDADFRKCLTQKIMLYALGRGLEPYDQCAIDSVCASMQKHHDTFSSLIVAVVQSDPFNYRKGTKAVASAVGANQP